MRISNPILKGFNPDPCIVRVGMDYYIATSTFEWFPGVQIHHSTDLRNWQLITRPLDRLSQLDLRGVPDSCGVWAPCLTYDNGTFYLVYSNVKSFAGVWKDTPNYLVTAPAITGPWSDPISLNSSGFDGSLFHDENGRKWYTSLLVDHRNRKFFGGIILQEYDADKKQLTGPVHHIFEGTSLGITEGPHLYKKDDYYYLVTAEGGTEFGHAVTVARSRHITGPYEVHPQNPLITSVGYPDHPLQKAGHASLVQTHLGDWIAVFLVGRPYNNTRRCMLGRETAIEIIDWPENDWPRLSSGTSLPRMEVEIESLQDVPHQDSAGAGIYSFDEDKLNIHFQSLRIPITDDWCSLDDRKGFLTIKGQESLSSFNRQSLVARRIQSLQMEAATCLDFSPVTFQQMAGLVCYYNTAHFHYLHISADDNGNRCLQIITFDNFEHNEALAEPVGLPNEGLIYLKAELNGGTLQFSYALEPDNWRAVGPELDATILSDDYVQNRLKRYMPAFTGAMVGMCCQDLTGNKKPAYFNWFSYYQNEETKPKTLTKHIAWEKSY